MPRRKLASLALALGLVLAPALGAPGGAPAAGAILEQSDRYRAAWDSFAVAIRITNFKGDRAEEESQYEVYVKDRTKSYVKFLNAREKGRALLMLEDDMWLYMPAASRPIRITPLQRLTGKVSNGDVARTNYAGDYTAVVRGEEALEGTECYVLALTARRKGATYPRIDYWVSRADSLPRKAEFFLTSGKNHKTAVFDSYRDFGGRRLVARMTIYDKIRRDEKSVLEYVRYARQEIPDKYFNKNSMGTN